MKMRELVQKRGFCRINTPGALLALVCVLALFPNALNAAPETERPFVHPLFSDHMVLQRGMKAPVWGWASPGTKVTVQFAGQTKTAVADADGKWMVHLDKLKASTEPRELTIGSSGAEGTVKVEDVLVGDVWLCTGQSNMEMGIGNCNVPDDIATANFPEIRLLTVPRLIAVQPVRSASCHWLPCSPSNIMQGVWNGFSAAGFFFGRELHRELGVPIGLIHSSWGGTVAEAWTSAEGLKPLGDFDNRLEKESQMDTTAEGSKKNPNIVTVLYNGMIAPLQPFAIRGAIWYQGESNAGRAYQYRALLPALIQDWRRGFDEKAFPFYIVQLAAFQATNSEPRDNDWAELREAQALTARNALHCGLAVAIDIGNAKDIHPKNKAEVGRRLALCALATTYGRRIEYAGPWYKGMKKDGSRVRLKFDHVDGGLVAHGDDLKGFAVAGEDHHFVWANAVIAGNTVVVSSPDVPNPVAVRYAWDIDPVCNLYNRVGLPAVPFRTDDWRLTTQGKK